MNLKDYATKAERTLPDLGQKTANDLHMVLGVVTEAGELADAIKKKIAYGKEIDWVNVQEEIGDIMWYIINFCTLNNFNLEKILDVNIRKLEIRYPEKFSTENATNRDLEKEREVLNNLSENKE